MRRFYLNITYAAIRKKTEENSISPGLCCLVLWFKAVLGSLGWVLHHFVLMMLTSCIMCLNHLSSTSKSLYGFVVSDVEEHANLRNLDVQEHGLGDVRPSAVGLNRLLFCNVGDQSYIRSCTSMEVQWHARWIYVQAIAGSRCNAAGGPLLWVPLDTTPKLVARRIAFSRSWCVGLDLLLMSIASELKDLRGWGFSNLSVSPSSPKQWLLVCHAGL